MVKFSLPSHVPTLLLVVKTPVSRQHVHRGPEAGVLVRKLSHLSPLSSAKRSNPKCFIMLCGISCELAGCVHTPAYRGLRVHDSLLRPNQTLVIYTLAGLAKSTRKLNFFNIPALDSNASDKICKKKIAGRFFLNF